MEMHDICVSVTACVVAEKTSVCRKWATRFPTGPSASALQRVLGGAAHERECVAFRSNKLQYFIL